MDYVIGKKSEIGGPLVCSLLEDRRAQFVDRLGWDLCVSPEGFETDEYDSGGTTFMVVHECWRHVGSCRVRPVWEGTMLIDHFSAVFPEAAEFLANQSGRIWELTRFCRSPKAGEGEAKDMLKLLAEMLDDFRDDNGITGFVAVVYPEVARFLNRIGVRYLRLAVSEIDGREAHLICITHCVAPARATAERRRGAEFIRAARAQVAANDARAA